MHKYNIYNKHILLVSENVPDILHGKYNTLSILIHDKIAHKIIII